MLESRNYYSNYKETGASRTKGWVVELKDSWGCNRGCVGFETKVKAEKWLKESEERIRSSFNIEGDAMVYKI